MKFVRIAAIDPAFSNFGVARMLLRLEDMKLGVESLHLIETEKDQSKTVRRNSDDMRRCKHIIETYHPIVKPCPVVFAEIPSGAQSARAAVSLAYATALVASCPVDVIEVQPAETKMATVGTKTASKEEMIEWALETFPTAPWVKDPKGRLVKSKNEHLADACAVAVAGVKTPQFRQLVSLWRATPIAA